MSTFQFATCERARALQFLGKLFPSKKLTDSGTIAEVLNLVATDKIRVLDPDFHPGAIVQSNATDAEWVEAQPMLIEMVQEIRAMEAERGSASPVLAKVVEKVLGVG